MNIPAALTDIDAAFLTEAFEGVAEFEGADWTGATPERIGVGYGLDGTVARVRSRGAVPRSAVVKFGERDDPGRETRFYREFESEFPLRLARLWNAEYDDDARRYVLVLEDIEEAEQGDCTAGPARREQANRIVDGIARMHARYVGATHPFVAALPKWSLDLGKAREKWDGALAQCRVRARDDWQVEWTTASDADWAAFPERFEAAYEASAGADLTLSHTDFHLDNVLFVGDDPVVLDWPDVRRAPTTTDLARFLIEGVNATQRREWGEDLLGRYAAAWSDECGSPLPSTWRRELSAHLLWGVVFAVAWTSREHEQDNPPRIAAIVRSLLVNAGALFDDGWLEF